MLKATVEKGENWNPVGGPQRTAVFAQPIEVVKANIISACEPLPSIGY